MTIKDIAAIAGVSATTVSMVLNNKADSISEETREKVLRIAKEYNFKPYAKAIQNASARSGLVGLLIPGDTRMFIDFVAGAQEAAAAEGYSLILCSCGNEQETKKHLNGLYSKGVDGVALYLAEEIDLPSLFADAPEKLAYVAVSNRQSAAGLCSAFCAVFDAAILGTERLIAAGHNEITLLGWRDRPESGEFVSGYSTALYRHNIPMQSERAGLCACQEELERFIRQATDNKSTAFLCQDQSVAACVYRVMDRCGLRIPKDCSVVCMSDGAAALDIFTPELSTIDLRRRELGRTAMRELIARIEGGSRIAQETQRLLPELRQGASVAPPLTSKRIVVVGSMNMDTMIHLSHLPTSGESLLSQRIINLPGGKGANQAVGAAKLGGDVCVIGCLGDDQEGRLLRSSLVENGVNTTGVLTISGKPTGKAYILVSEKGESTIVFSYGTNGELLPGIIERNESLFAGAEFCLLSTEIPWDTVLYTIDLCVRHHVQVILKPTIQRPISSDILEKIDYLIPNEKELDVQVSGDLSAEEKAERLFSRGVRNVIVTLADKGCYLRSPEIKRAFPAADFVAVDTTGAGDAFISAFAVYLSEGHDITSSIQFATYAAGISVTRDGVQPAMAERIALEMYTDQYSAHQAD